MSSTLAEGSFSPFLETVDPSRIPNTGFTADFLDSYASAIDQALGIEKASLSAIVGLNSSALDICQDVLRRASAPWDLWGTAINAFAFYMESQLNWLTLMSPRVYGETLATPAPSGVVASSSDGPAELLECSMDVVIAKGESA
jgi:hypothetical protein